MKGSIQDVEGYLQELRNLGFVRRASVRAGPVGAPIDMVLVIRTPTGVFRLPARRTRSLLGGDLAEHLASVAQRTPGLVLLTPAVGRYLGDYLAEHRVNFIDLAGNCSLRLGDRYHVRIQGRTRIAARPPDRAMRAPAYRVLLALLIREEVVASPGRTLAEAAGGVSPQTAVDLRKRLVARGDLLASPGGFQWAPLGRRRATEMWLAGFSTTLFPSLSVGRFRAQGGDPAAVEKALRRRLGPQAGWRWGGSAAADRLTGYYRGPRTVVYLAVAPADPGRWLALVPSPEGDVWLARSPGPAAFIGPNGQCVHPLLVYADLLAEADDRARDAAAELRDRFLPELARDEQGGS